MDYQGIVGEIPSKVPAFAGKRTLGMLNSNVRFILKADGRVIVLCKLPIFVGCIFYIL